jgi:hypothetical protein
VSEALRSTAISSASQSTSIAARPTPAPTDDVVEASGSAGAWLPEAADPNDE